jgi:HD-like signal output (HDOD) protein
MLSAREIILKKKILSIPDIPTLSANIMELIRLLSKEEVDLNPVFDCIKRDPVLVTKMLKIVNSSLYALPRKIESVEMVVTLLGVRKIKEIILSASVMDTINSSDSKLWDHSYTTATLISQIIRQERLQVSSNITITALVHEIGQVVLNMFNPKGEKMAIAKMETDKVPLHEAEKAILDVDHAVVGGWLMEAWQLDEDIVVPVSYQHNHEEVNEKYVKEIALLQIADYIDETVREMPAHKVPLELLAAAGMENIDIDYWLDFQMAASAEEE